MPALPKRTTDPEVLKAFDAMLAGVEGVERKGDSVPYTSINGNMYSSLSKPNCIGLRLSPEDRAEFMAKYEAPLYEGLPGFFQKEYVELPAALLKDTKTLRAWFRKSHAYASGLKAKKTTKG